MSHPTQVSHPHLYALRCTFFACLAQRLAMRGCGDRYNFLSHGTWRHCVLLKRAKLDVRRSMVDGRWSSFFAQHRHYYRLSSVKAKQIKPNPIKSNQIEKSNITHLRQVGRRPGYSRQRFGQRHGQVFGAVKRAGHFDIHNTCHTTRAV